VGRPKNEQVRAAILREWASGHRTPSEIARRLGLPVYRVKYYLHVMRREGVLPKSEPHADLVEGALTELKGAVVLASYLYAELHASKLAREVEMLRGHVERALRYVELMSKVRSLERR